MKHLLLLLTLLFSVSAFAQNHMIEFKADSLLLGNLAYSKEKNRGESSRDSNFSALYLNFARTVSEHLQAGLQANYNHSGYVSGKSEDYSVLLGAIYNLGDDFRNSVYASAYAGWEWDHDYDDSLTNDHNENLIGKIALGKRIPLSFLNLENVTYSPEIQFTSRTATKSTSSHDWSQELTLKFLQFSIFW